MVDHTRIRRDPVRQEASRAQAVLDNPDLNTVFERTRVQLIADIEGFEFDGTEDGNARALELVRRLQALVAVRGTIMAAIRNLKLAEATVSG